MLIHDNYLFWYSLHDVRIIRSSIQDESNNDIIITFDFLTSTSNKKIITIHMR